MGRLRLVLLATMVEFMGGCGQEGNAKAPSAAVPADRADVREHDAFDAGAFASDGSTEHPREQASESTMEIPNRCEQDGPVCMPSPAFVDVLCRNTYREVALHLFGKTPFTRGYLARDVDGWNADGGRSPRVKLVFDEEVLVLKKREAPKGAVVVSGAAGGYLVLRWDGGCYTLASEELTLRRPPKPKHPLLPLRLYDDATREALLGAANVHAAREKRDKECKGAPSGGLPSPCERSELRLSDAVVLAVKSGIVLPRPVRLPPPQ